jgi:hypothetical protein
MGVVAVFYRRHTHFCLPSSSAWLYSWLRIVKRLEVSGCGVN